MADEAPVTFEVTSGRMAVSDPCYAPGTWCMGYLDPVPNGTWIASAKYLIAAGWGERIAQLEIWHKDALGKIEPTEDDWSPADHIDVGVDSGQAGFFDGDYFDQTPRGEYGDTESFYGRACTLTHTDAPGAPHYQTFGSLFGRGVVTSSGFGDGSYDCFVLLHEARIVAVRLVFIFDEELEGDDEFDRAELDEVVA